MMLEEARIIERVGGADTEEHMRIKPSRKAFRAISTILYKDRIKAIIREISCNAADAHIDAGCSEKPFEVHLPNKFDPYFSVRDFGKGISPEEMKTVYMTYFESTKEEKPEETGSLGLGSKSPLCYTNSFTVTSYHNGKRCHYAIFFDEEDFPTYKLLSAEPSNAESGLEVKVPLANMYDCSVFAEKAKDVFQYFPTKPEFFGDPLYIPETNILIQGDGWRYVLGKHRTYPVAVMAKVAYPIEAHSIPNLSDNVKDNLKRPQLEIDFPNDSLTYMPGRDDLSYDKKTCKAISDRVQYVHDDWQAAINRELDKCENEYKARYRSVEIDKAIGRTSVQHSYKGIAIEPLYNLTELGLPPATMVWTHNGKRRVIEPTNKISVDEKVIYCIDDTKSGLSKVKIHEYMKKNWRTVNFLYIFRVADGYDAANVKWIEASERLDVINNALPNVPFQSVDDIGINAAIARDPYGKRQSREYVTLNHYECLISRNQGKWNRRHWSDTSTLPENGIYVMRKHNNIEGAWIRGTYADIEFIKLANNADIISKNDFIYGFNKIDFKKLSGDWIELNDLIKSRVKQKIECYGGDISDRTKDDLHTLRATYSEFSPIFYMNQSLESLKDVPHEHPLVVFFRDCKAINETNHDSFHALCIKLGHIKTKSVDLTEQWASLIIKYPLFPRHTNAGSSPEHLKKYITMCDEELVVNDENMVESEIKE